MWKFCQCWTQTLKARSYSCLCHPVAPWALKPVPVVILRLFILLFLPGMGTDIAGICCSISPAICRSTRQQYMHTHYIKAMQISLKKNSSYFSIFLSKTNTSNWNCAPAILQPPKKTKRRRKNRKREKERKCCIYLALCVSLQTLLISVLYHLSDLLNERLPLTLQDKLTLDLNTQTHRVKKVRLRCVCV